MSAVRASLSRPGAGRKQRREQLGLYIWTAVVLAVGVAVVILSWHAKGGTTDPTDLAAQPSPEPHHGRARQRDPRVPRGARDDPGAGRDRRELPGRQPAVPQAGRRGQRAGACRRRGHLVVIVWVIHSLPGSELTIQAATGLPALLVLLLVMNWFFHKVYWTGWISHHNKRRRGLLSSDPDTNKRRLLLGLALLGFTSVYRECFEIVIFLQNLRELYGASIVLEGVVIGLMFTAAVGVLTFTLHQRLPYKRLLIITGVMLLFVLRRRGGRGGQRDAARRLDRHHRDQLAAHPGLDGHVVEPVQ